jgi:hypothetical protein
MIITSLDHCPISNLDDFVRVVTAIPDGKFIKMQYLSLEDLYCPSSAMISIDRHWYDFRIAQRDEAISGPWHFEYIRNLTLAEPITPRVTSFPSMKSHPEHLRYISHGFAKIHFNARLSIEGNPYSRNTGFMLVLNTQYGIGVSSREVVPHAAGTVDLIFGSVQIPGKVIFLHPTYNLVFLRYNPELLGSTRVIAGKLASDTLTEGQFVNFIGIDGSSKIRISNCQISDISPKSSKIFSDLSLNINSTTIVTKTTYPHFRDTNFEAIELDSVLAGQCPFGVLANEVGDVVGLWLEFLGSSDGEDDSEMNAIPIRIIQDILAAILANVERSLDVTIHISCFIESVEYFYSLHFVTTCLSNLTKYHCLMQEHKASPKA